VTDSLASHDRPADLVLARVHLRLGSLSLARAELETLAGRDALDEDGLVDLAEARWRTGDIEGAGEAARAALRDDDGPLLALVVAAEAAAARGRPTEARRLASKAMAAADGAIDTIFAGMPRGAAWPPDPAAPPPAPTTMFGPSHGGRGTARPARRPSVPVEPLAAQAEPASEARDASAIGLWDPTATGEGQPAPEPVPDWEPGVAEPEATPDAEPGGDIEAEAAAGAWAADAEATPDAEPGAAAAADAEAVAGAWAADAEPGRAAPAEAAADAAADAEAASDAEPGRAAPAEAAADAEPGWAAPAEPGADAVVEVGLPDAAAAVDRGRQALEVGAITEAAWSLGLALRLDQGVAPRVIELVGDRSDPALAFVRGDAYRLVGRERDALRAYAGAVPPVAAEHAVPGPDLATIAEPAIDAFDDDVPTTPTDDQPPEGDRA
jgi:hypothetical protein